MTEFNLYTVIYEFKHSKMGFQNSITVCALNPEMALNNAKSEVSGCYGLKMLPRFAFKEPTIKGKPTK
jgi:hypothetical protein